MWRTGTYSNGTNCAEAAGRWRTSSASASGNCAEVGQVGSVVLVRDTQDRAGPVLAFSAASWRTFLAAIRQA